jgi:hypothetical protein
LEIESEEFCEGTTELLWKEHSKCNVTFDR